MRSSPRRREVNLSEAVDGLERSWEVLGHDGDGVSGLLE